MIQQLRRLYKQWEEHIIQPLRRLYKQKVALERNASAKVEPGADHDRVVDTSRGAPESKGRLRVASYKRSHGFNTVRGGVFITQS